MKNNKSSHLAKNVFYNIAGQALPVFAAAFSIPVLIHKIGADRFGLLTIAWMVVGYFSLFDLGLGRALTKLTSDRLGSGRSQEVPALVSGGLSLMLVFGTLGAVTIGLLSGEITRLLHTPFKYASETRNSFILLAASIPAVILTSGLRGILEAYQRFDITNVIRTPLGLWTFAGPLCALPFTHRLDWIVLLLVIGRCASMLFYLHYTKKQTGARMFDFPTDRRLYVELLSFGGWMTISNIVSPLMVYMDRFFIGAILGTGVVAFYTTPYEVIFKFNIISEGLFGVLFPMMAQRLSTDQNLASNMLPTGTKLIAGCLLPPVLVISVFAQTFLTVWLGGNFASHSVLVMQLLAIGLLINGFAKVSFNLLQAHGRADVTAKLHLVELPVYILALIIFTRKWGIEGTAACWALRMILDATLLYWMTDFVAHVSRNALGQSIRLAAFSALVVVPAIFITHSNVRIIYFVVAAVIYGLIFFKFSLSNDERRSITRSLKLKI